MLDLAASYQTKVEQITQKALKTFSSALAGAGIAFPWDILENIFGEGATLPFCKEGQGGRGGQSICTNF